MGKTTEISWTDHTFNPWWGCVKVSPACTHCYAATFAGRFNVEWGPKAERRFFDQKHWNEPLKWDRKAKAHGLRRRVFCASMADVFEALPEDHPDADRMAEERMRLWGIVNDTPNLDWLLLTKRPENIPAMVPYGWMHGAGFPSNVWCGTTAENQEYADQRIPALLQVPAAVRFLSCEPLLGPVDVDQWLDCGYESGGPQGWVSEPSINWVIVGGESGPGARPMHPDWARSLRDQCVAAGVPFHFKQWGEWQPRDCMTDVPDTQCDEWGVNEIPLLPDGTDCRGYEALADGTKGCRVLRKVGKKAAGRLLDGRAWDEFPAATP